MSSLYANLIKAAEHAGNRHDGRGAEPTVYKMYYEDMSRHLRGRVPDAVPAIAFVAWTVPLDGPMAGDVLESKKVGEGVLAFWRNGSVTALAYDLGWGRVHTILTPNDELQLTPKTLVNIKKKQTVPALQLTAAGWDKGVLVAVKVRSKNRYNENAVRQTFGFIEENLTHQA